MRRTKHGRHSARSSLRVISVDLSFTSLSRILCLAVLLTSGGVLASSRGVASSTKPPSAAAFSPSASMRVQGIQLNHVHPVGTGPYEPLVDGSKNPELIPDHVALRALIQTIVVPSQPTDDERKQFELRTARMDLTEEDSELLLTELGRFHDQMMIQKARIEAARPRSVASANEVAIGIYAGEQARLGDMIVGLYNSLLGSLSRDGATKLREHLAYVKTRMKIFPTPNMETGLQ
jgi:hypothetical protein